MAGIKATEEQVTEVTSDTSVSKANSGGGLTVNIGKNYDNFNNTIADVQNMSMFAQRGHEAFMINKKTHSSIAIRQNGQINLAADFYSQYKINPGGKITEQSLESTVITNRRSVIADDILINEHKLNPYLYELTNMKKLETPYNDKVIVGNLCMAGSILVKAWEPDLHRYVLIRRPVRLPVFSPLLNVPEINEGLGVTDPLKIDEQILAKSTKGYHGNVAQTDAKSLIGKEGFNRDGVDAESMISIGNNTTAGSGGTAGNWDFSNVGSSNGKCKGGTGGGLGADIIGTNGPLGKMSADEVNMLKYISLGLGVPMDWIYCQMRNESGLDTDNCTAHIYNDFNYGGIMNAGGESAGVRKFSSCQEFAEAYVKNISGLYYAPDCTLAKTAQDYYHCLQHQHHEGEGGNGQAWDFAYCANPSGDAYVDAIMVIAMGLPKMTKLN